MCGQLGHRNKQHQLLPKQIESLSKKKTIDIACGNLHTLALAEDNVLYIWGYVSDDHLGLSEGEEYHSAPILVDTSHITNQIVRVAAGSWHSALLTSMLLIFHMILIVFGRQRRVIYMGFWISK